MDGYTSDWRMRILLAWASIGCCWTVVGVTRPSTARAAEENPAAAPEAEITAATADRSVVQAKPDDPALVEQWVRELDDDHYAVREAAQKRLADCGLPALETLARVAASGSLEAATRAVNVLVGWADGKDSQLAIAALEKVAALETRPTEAAMAHERLAVVREAAAMEAIKELGGRFEHDRAIGLGGGPSTPLKIVLGPKWKGGIDGLSHVAAVRSATILGLHATPLSDEALVELAKLTQLRRIEIFGAGISPDAIAKLQPQMPNTEFDIRKGARLGIMDLPIAVVVTDSAAAKAGLQQGDNIIEFAGQPIANFTELTQAIAKCKGGDTVTIKIKRGEETLEKSVTFDRWGDDERSLDSPEMQQQRFAPVQIQAGGRIIIQPRGGQIVPVPAPVQPNNEQRR